jgi:prenyltransferase beta subunit
MEVFGATDAPPVAHSVERVQEADVYLGIFGMRDGTIDPDSGQSITEREYREAKLRNLPCLVYLMDEDTPVVSRHVDKGEDAQKLAALKRELCNASTGHVVGFFRSPDHLAAQVAVDVAKTALMVERGRPLQGLRRRVDHAIERGWKFILELQGSDGGWPYAGGGCNVWDTASSLLALKAANADCDAAIHRAHRQLLRMRNARGGWQAPWETDPDASTTVDTAIAIAALFATGYDEHQDELDRSIRYLRDAQHPSGGWGAGIGTDALSTAATSWAVRALVLAGLSPQAEWAALTREFLLRMQQQDGGWSAGPHAVHSTIGKTKDALVALFVLRLPANQDAFISARGWLERVRGGDASPEAFARIVGVEPNGANPATENVIHFLESSFYIRIPGGEARIRGDLDWLATRRTWGYTPQAVSCLSLYRSWIS